jgi:inner membrane protein
MDTLTHALSGALLARATVPVRPGPGELTSGARMTVGFVAAAFPDSDFVLRLFDTLTYVSLHRGVTHSIVLLPGWALLLAWLLSFLWRQRYSWRAIYGTAALGIAIHIAGDVITSYGTMLLAPFSRQAFAVPFTFIIDPYFTAIIAIGLVAGRFRPGSRYPAVAALVILGCYVGFQGVLHSHAIKIGEAYKENQGLINAQVHAFPQPLSPFNWKIIVSHKGEYEVALVNLRRKQNYAPSESAIGILGMWERIDAGYRSPSAAAWVRYKQFGENAPLAVLARQAWDQEIFTRFRGFAKFPVLDQIEFAGNVVCVSFFDLRFTVPSLPPSLVFGLCRDSPVGPWRFRHDPGLFGRD